MTNDVKLKIIELRDKGLGYKAIAKELGVSVGSVQHFCKNINSHPIYINIKETFCKECGCAISQRPKTKTKLFCSNKCRQSWWNKNLDKVNKKVSHTFICAECNKEFTLYGITKRKYCSHACYSKSKIKEVTPDER